MFGNTKRIEELEKRVVQLDWSITNMANIQAQSAQLERARLNEVKRPVGRPRKVTKETK